MHQAQQRQRRHSRSHHSSRSSNKENSVDSDNNQPSTLTSAKLNALSNSKFNAPVDEEIASNVTAESKYSRRSNMSRSSSRRNGGSSKHSATMSALGKQMQAAVEGTEPPPAAFSAITEEEACPAPRPASPPRSLRRATLVKSPIRSPVRSPIKNAAVNRKSMPTPGSARKMATDTSPTLFQRASSNLKRLSMSAKKGPKPAAGSAAQNRSIASNTAAAASAVTSRKLNLIALSKLRSAGSDVRMFACDDDHLLFVGRRSVLYARREFSAPSAEADVEELASIVHQVSLKELFDVQTVRGLHETSLQLILRHTPSNSNGFSLGGMGGPTVHSLPMSQADAAAAAEAHVLISENLAAYRRGAEAKRQGRKSRRSGSTGSVASNMSCTASECGEFDAFEFSGVGGDYWTEAQSAGAAPVVVVPLTLQKLQSRDREFSARVEGHRQPFAAVPESVPVSAAPESMPVSAAPESVSAPAVAVQQPTEPEPAPVVGVVPVSEPEQTQVAVQRSTVPNPNPAPPVVARGRVAEVYLSSVAKSNASCAAPANAPMPKSTPATAPAVPVSTTAPEAPVSTPVVTSSTIAPSSSNSNEASSGGGSSLAVTLALVSTGLLLSGGCFCLAVWHRVLSPQQRSHIMGPGGVFSAVFSGALWTLFPAVKPTLSRR